MPTVAVMADPPAEGVLPGLHETLGSADATALYEAMLGDVCAAVQNGAGELLVNYRDAEDAESRLRNALSDELPRPGDARYEVQVGETFAGRAGNTVTHLLESEGVDSVAVLEPTAAFVFRETLGTLTMKLRTRDVVVGPSTGGRVYLAAFRAPIDFADAFEPPALETVVERARDADLEVDFTPTLPVVETRRDLVTAVTQIRARVAAGRNVPPRTAEFVADHDLRVVTEDERLRVVAG
jgi:2-phospho-L-lactate guanylyltransferase (CobY/MobA/RfbA family)